MPGATRSRPATWWRRRPVLISWGWNPMTGAWRTWEMSPNPGGLPYAPVKTLILVGFGLLLLGSLWALWRTLA